MVGDFQKLIFFSLTRTLKYSLYLCGSNQFHQVGGMSYNKN